LMIVVTMLYVATVYSDSIVNNQPRNEEPAVTVIVQRDVPTHTAEIEASTTVAIGRPVDGSKEGCAVVIIQPS
jgi:hypothetical protein